MSRWRDRVALLVAAIWPTAVGLLLYRVEVTWLLALGLWLMSFVIVVGAYLLGYWYGWKESER